MNLIMFSKQRKVVWSFNAVHTQSWVETHVIVFIYLTSDTGIPEYTIKTTCEDIQKLKTTK